MAKMIYLLGTDGSGKTTLAQNLVRRYAREGKRIKYLYVRHVPILLYPLKLLSRILVYKQDSQFKNYGKYSEKKSRFSRKHPFLARLYAAVWVLDYSLYYWLKVHWAYWFSGLIILDRYVADVVVNISVATGLDARQGMQLLRMMHRLFPRPDRSFFIEVDSEEAFRRKDDIPSVQYLQERKEHYFELRPFYEFEVLDGHQTPEALVETLHQKIAQEVN